MFDMTAPIREEVVIGAIAVIVVIVGIGLGVVAYYKKRFNKL